jgi:hypothetical protein
LVASLAGCASDAASDDDSQALTQGTGSWDKTAETEFSNFIARIGKARADGRCLTLNACINDATINPYKAAGDANLDLFADCADVPMELRAYFAVKTGRVFIYVSAIQGDGPDERYAKNNHPVSYANAASSRTMQRLMSSLSGTVDSGFFRMAPDVEPSDTYPIKPSRASLRPGTVYYDPNGHVLIVYRVDADGTIWTIDGHPDNSLTFGRFTEGAYAVGGRAQGGGFRNFRPQKMVSDGISFVRNSELTDFGDNQYGHGTGYFDWLRSQISDAPPPAPEKKLNDRLDQLCADLQNRVGAVDAGRALASGALGPIPPNIYGADGDWEAFSTPGRDARLRGSFRGAYKFITDALAAAPAETRGALAASFGAVWRAHTSSAACTITYTNSAGAAKRVTLEALQQRIYDLSFDPYHCPEMRWGAHPKAPDEAASCSNADADHLARFDAERRNRNVIDRDPTAATGPDYGPDVPEDIDVAGLLQRSAGL